MVVTVSMLVAQAPPMASPPTALELVGLAFPGCEIRWEVVALTAAQQQRVVEQSGVARGTATCRRFLVQKEGKCVGAAYVDARTVRSQGQSLLVCVDAAGKVLRIEVLQFAEPRQYRPRPEFFAQFVGQKLDDQLQLRRGIRPVAGATMSARAAVDAVRTVLAVHAVLVAR